MSIRRFFLDLDTDDRLFSRFGWGLVGAVPLFAICGFVLTSPAISVSPWIKPIKFSISFATFVWTLSLFLMALEIPIRVRKFVRGTVVFSVTVEMLALSFQAWRAGQSHLVRSFADTIASQVTTAMVVIDTAILIWLLAMFSRRPSRLRISDTAMLAAIRISILIFLAGSGIGGYMLARGSHTVGASDGGPGLPFLNWSTIAGDLRIAHFIAVHAIQIVPLFAYLLGQMKPRPSAAQRRITVYAVSALVALTIGATFVQASLGRPLLP